MLEATRRHVPEGAFVNIRTNKVYGGRANTLTLKELDTRWEYADAADFHGIREELSLD
jgi:CDP-paratose 2-epimerase